MNCYLFIILCYYNINNHYNHEPKFLENKTQVYKIIKNKILLIR